MLLLHHETGMNAHVLEAIMIVQAHLQWRLSKRQVAEAHCNGMRRGQRGSSCRISSACRCSHDERARRDCTHARVRCRAARALWRGHETKGSGWVLLLLVAPSGEVEVEIDDGLLMMQ